MIKKYIIVDPDGAINGIVLCGEQEAEGQAFVGQAVIAAPSSHVSDLTHYVDDGQILEKQPLNFSDQTITADGDDTAVISGIPVGVKCTWHDGQENIINDGVVEMATDLPGTYVLRFTGVPYLDTEVTIEAVAAA